MVVSASDQRPSLMAVESVLISRCRVGPSLLSPAAAARRLREPPAAGCKARMAPRPSGLRGVLQERVLAVLLV